MHDRLLVLFPDYKEGDWELQDNSDGKGIFIKKWNRPEPQPAQTEIDAVTQRQIDASTWKAKRNARYKAEADPLYIQAIAQAQTDGTPPDFTAHSAKVTQIKTEIPKVI